MALVLLTDLRQRPRSSTGAQCPAHQGRPVRIGPATGDGDLYLFAVDRRTHFGAGARLLPSRVGPPFDAVGPGHLPLRRGRLSDIRGIGDRRRLVACGQGRSQSARGGRPNLLHQLFGDGAVIAPRRHRQRVAHSAASPIRPALNRNERKDST